MWKPGELIMNNPNFKTVRLDVKCTEVTKCKDFQVSQTLVFTVKHSKHQRFELLYHFKTKVITDFIAETLQNS